MTSARQAALSLALQQVHREMRQCMEEQGRHYAKANELSAVSAEQESHTAKASYLQASIRERARGDAYRASIASLAEQERAIERELDTSDFLFRIGRQQADAVDETAGIAA